MSHPGPLMLPNVFMRPTETRFLPEGRHWVCGPSLEKTPGGRLFMTCTSGARGEDNGTYAFINMSEDDGKNWTDPVMTVEHPLNDCRVFESVLWTDPAGRLWLFFSQAHGRYDSRFGVWAMVCENPDREIKFSAPRRISNGIMRNKPTALSGGRWVLCCPLMGKTSPQYPGCPLPTEIHPELDGERLLNVYASDDNGNSFYKLGTGGFERPLERDFDEPMIVERNDKSLWMLTRANYGIGESISTDGGATWTKNHDSGIPGPSSRFFIRRLRSGQLLMVNHYQFSGRNNMAALLSPDDGKTWPHALMLDIREKVTYPDGCEDKQGNIYVVYDHQRYVDKEVMMTVFTQEDIVAGAFVSEHSRPPYVISKALS